MSSIIIAYTFIYCGAWMAPKHQFIVSIVLIVLLTIFATVSFLFTFSDYSSIGTFEYLVHGIILLITGGYVVFSLKENV